MNDKLNHYELFYKKVPCIAQIEDTNSPEKYILDQFWCLTYSDLPPEVFCFEFDKSTDKELFMKLAKENKHEPREFAKHTLLEKIAELQQKTASLESQLEYLNEQRRKSNIDYFIKVIDELKGRLKRGHYKETSGEDNWQSWIYRHNWLFGVQYEKPIEKEKIGFDSIPDFIFPTMDGFLDVLEIKTPDLPVIKEDKSHTGAFSWTSQSSEAIGQVVNYLHEIEVNQLFIAKRIREKYGKHYHTIKPRAFILIDTSDTWLESKKEALRKLNFSLHGIEVLTYSDLVKRGENLIAIYNDKEVSNVQ